MASTYQRDWWLWPIVVTSSNNSFVFTETGGSTFTVTIAAGTYYTHRDSSIDTDYPSLWLALETAIGAESTTNTYTFSAQTPTQSVEQFSAGIRLTGTAGTSVEFSIDFSSGSFTLDPRLLGFPSTQSADVTAVAEGSDHVLDSVFTVFGTWRAFSLFDGKAAEKRGDERVLSIDSHDRPSDRYPLEWFEERYRPVSYQRVYAAHVYRYAARDLGYATVGKLAQNDTHNAFYYIWRELLRDDNPVIVCHNVGDVWDLQVDTYDSEAVKRAGSFPTSFREWTGEPVQRAGEFYNLELDLFIDDDINGYFH